MAGEGETSGATAAAADLLNQLFDTSAERAAAEQQNMASLSRATAKASAATAKAMATTEPTFGVSRDLASGNFIPDGNKITQYLEDKGKEALNAGKEFLTRTLEDLGLKDKPAAQEQPAQPEPTQPAETPDVAQEIKSTSDKLFEFLKEIAR